MDKLFDGSDARGVNEMGTLNAAQRMQMIEKFETLTIKEYGVLVYENEQLRQRVAKLEKELNEVRKAEREKCAALCEKSDRYRGDYFAAKIRALE